MYETDTYKLSEECSFSIAPAWGSNMFSWRSGGQELMYCPEGYREAALFLRWRGQPP